MIKTIFLLAGSAVVLLGFTGCASTEDIRRERDSLARELTSQKSINEQLKGENATLNEQLTFMKKVASSLKTEKEVRTEETAMVRSEVRAFIRKQVEAVRQFSYNSKLTDSIGGEVIDRSNVDGEDQLLVDMQHVCQSSGTLVGGRIYARAPMKFNFCTVRPFNNEFVVIWVSPTYAANKPGVSSVTFEIPVNVEKGDRLGLMTAGAVQVPYDVGTGDVRSISGTVKEGDRLRASDLKGRDKRNYSFSLLGFMD